MKSQRVITGAIFAVVIAFIAYQVLRVIGAAHAYSGPGVRGNLVALEVAKARWVAAHTNGDWPSMQDVTPYLTNGLTRFGTIRPVWREIYLINKVGTPVLAYDPRTERVSFVNSNEYLRILEWDYK